MQPWLGSSSGHHVQFYLASVKFSDKLIIKVAFLAAKTTRRQIQQIAWQSLLSSSWMFKLFIS